MSHGFEGEIDDYVDGTLPPDRVAALEAHLRACPECRAVETDFRTLRSAAASLEPHVPPARVWARVAAGVSAPDSSRRGWLAWVPPGLTWRPAIAAAVVVALLASGTWFSWREVSGRRTPTVAQTTPSASVPASGVEQQMRTQISDMEGIVRGGSSMLPRETRAAYQAGIDDIDSALDRPREVLAAEPSNEVAQQSLLELLQSKLTLLQEMIALINEMRKGNQEEAARIVSGMEQ